MRILLDNDVTIDYVVRREPFFENAERIFLLNAEERIEVWVSSITPINVFYIGKKLKGQEYAFKAVRRLVTLVSICTVDSLVLHHAFNLGIKDYEDAVQCASAVSEGLDAIVTRNISDFVGSPIPVHSPDDFLRMLNSESGVIGEAP